jgi:hypothetical protein
LFLLLGAQSRKQSPGKCSSHTWTLTQGLLKLSHLGKGGDKGWSSTLTLSSTRSHVFCTGLASHIAEPAACATLSAPHGWHRTNVEMNQLSRAPEALVSCPFLDSWSLGPCVGRQRPPWASICHHLVQGRMGRAWGRGARCPARHPRKALIPQRKW